ncbi:cellulase family glycosylhydrolase [Crossiella sp. NPDC003009]
MWRSVVTGMLAVVLGLAAVPGAPAQPARWWFDDGRAEVVTVSPEGTFRDGHGREVLLRGYNVSGTAKLAEHGGLPFPSTAEAAVSASSLRRLTGANAVRFLITWERVEPRAGQIDRGYLDRVAAQVKEFLNAGLFVFLDYHQDLYSRYLFNVDSWYTGDGAPEWVVRAGGYPKEYCEACVNWGQNMKNNKAVTMATYDFWHNRRIETEAGPRGILDAFLAQTETTLNHLRNSLSATEFRRVVGFNPLNEPYAGRYDEGQQGPAWERDLLAPFYQRVRAAMDRAGWTAKPLFAEPLVYWNINTSVFQEPGGLTEIPPLGQRFVFNAHFYDAKARSGILKPGKAGDGEYTADIRAVRERAQYHRTAPILTEFGHPITGFTSDKTPSILKAAYQSLDSGLAGKNWWREARNAAPPMSATQWQWDTNSGRHRELMNGNPNKVLTEADAWMDEDFSPVHKDNSGAVVPRVDRRVIDRAYPRAVAGRTLAFSFEDLSRDGGTVQQWQRVPAEHPAMARLTADRRHAVLIWRSTGSAAPTEVQLPEDLAAGALVSDLGTFGALPAYNGSGIGVERHAGATRLLLPGGPAGTLHVALIAPATTDPALLAQAKTELTGWAAASFGSR